MQNTSNRHRRKSNMTLHYSAITIIVLIIFAILSVTVFFNIESINIFGSSIYTVEEIIAASGIKGGDNMVRKNMGKAECAITSSLVYIETAEINRKLPSSVEIIVTPCIETASLQNGENGFFIVSKSGKILKITDKPVENTLVIYGTTPSENMTPGITFASEDENKTRIIFELMNRANGGFASKITSFDVSDRLNISCVYEDRIDIEFGVISDMDYKFRLAEEILATKISPDAKGRLKMLEDGAQFLSKSDLEHIEESYNINIATSGITETETTSSGSDDDMSTSLNFE